MTVQEVLDDALALVGTDVSVDDSLQPYAVNWANLCLSELFNYQNSRLSARGEPMMSAPPRVRDLEDEIPYDAVFSGAFTYFFAHWIYKDDRELSFAQEMYNRYVSEVKAHQMYTIGEVEDVYGLQ